MDPPREGVSEAVQSFRKAHVQTVMITGDHVDTALAIAKELGIAQSHEQCMKGEELDALSEEELMERVEGIRVFARVSPEHKVRIVHALKAKGKTVAMTGDGINDAPALRAADVGVAMGKGGTDVARNAADLILTDDNFSTIEKAIREGRGIYENIRKTILFLLSSNFGEIITMLVAILAGFPATLKASHIFVGKPDYGFPAGSCPRYGRKRWRRADESAAAQKHRYHVFPWRTVLYALLWSGDRSHQYPCLYGGSL